MEVFPSNAAAADGEASDSAVNQVGREMNKILRRVRLSLIRDEFFEQFKVFLLICSTAPFIPVGINVRRQLDELGFWPYPMTQGWRYNKPVEVVDNGALMSETLVLGLMIYSLLLVLCLVIGYFFIRRRDKRLQKKDWQSIKRDWQSVKRDRQRTMQGKPPVKKAKPPVKKAKPPVLQGERKLTDVKWWRTCRNLLVGVTIAAAVIACFHALASGEKTGIWLNEALRQIGTLHGVSFFFLFMLTMGMIIALVLVIGRLKQRIATKLAAFKAARIVKDPELRKQIRTAAQLLKAEDGKPPSTQLEGLRALVQIADTHKGSCQQRVVDILCDYLRTDDNNKVQLAIIEVFRAHLTMGQAFYSDKLWCHCAFNFLEVSFASKVDLSGVTFPQAVDFSKTVFRSSSSFAKATFSQGVSFYVAIFGGHADFAGATFGKDTNFSKATFNKGTSFENASIHGVADFYEMYSDGLVSFAGTVFHKDFIFTESMTSEISFEGTQFLEECIFYLAVFRHSAAFRDAVFSKSAFFEGGWYSGRTVFERVIFNEEARFEEAVFTDASFIDVTFAKKPDFTKAEFLEGSSQTFCTGIDIGNNGLPSDAVWLSDTDYKKRQ